MYTYIHMYAHVYYILYYITAHARGRLWDALARTREVKYKRETLLAIIVVTHFASE